MLRAIGAAEDLAHSSIRFGIGRFTTEDEVDYVVDKVRGGGELLLFIFQPYPDSRFFSSPPLLP